MIGRDKMVRGTVETEEKIKTMLEEVIADMKVINEEGRNIPFEEQYDDILEIEDKLKSIEILFLEYSDVEGWSELSGYVDFVRGRMEEILDTSQHVTRGSLENRIADLEFTLDKLIDGSKPTYTERELESLNRIKSMLEEHDRYLLNELLPLETQKFRQTLDPAREELDRLIERIEKRLQN